MPIVNLKALPQYVYMNDAQREALDGDLRTLSKKQQPKSKYSYRSSERRKEHRKLKRHPGKYPGAVPHHKAVVEWTYLEALQKSNAPSKIEIAVANEARSINQDTCTEGVNKESSASGTAAGDIFPESNKKAENRDNEVQAPEVCSEVGSDAPSINNQIDNNLNESEEFGASTETKHSSSPSIYCSMSTSETSATSFVESTPTSRSQTECLGSTQDDVASSEVGCEQQRNWESKLGELESSCLSPCDENQREFDEHVLLSKLNTLYKYAKYLKDQVKHWRTKHACELEGRVALRRVQNENESLKQKLYLAQKRESSMSTELASVRLQRDRLHSEVTQWRTKHDKYLVENLIPDHLQFDRREEENKRLTQKLNEKEGQKKELEEKLNSTNYELDEVIHRLREADEIFQIAGTKLPRTALSRAMANGNQTAERILASFTAMRRRRHGMALNKNPSAASIKSNYSKRHILSRTNSVSSNTSKFSATSYKSASSAAI